MEVLRNHLLCFDVNFFTVSDGRRSIASEFYLDHQDLNLLIKELGDVYIATSLGDTERSHFFKGLLAGLTNLRDFLQSIDKFDEDNKIKDLKATLELNNFDTGYLTLVDGNMNRIDRVHFEYEIEEGATAFRFPSKSSIDTTYYVELEARPEKDSFEELLLEILIDEEIVPKQTQESFIRQKRIDELYSEDTADDGWFGE